MGHEDWEKRSWGVFVIRTGFGEAACRSPTENPTSCPPGPGRTGSGGVPLLLALTPMAKRSTPCIFGELMTVVRSRGSSNISPSVSTTMTLDAFFLESLLVKMLSLSRGE